MYFRAKQWRDHTDCCCGEGSHLRFGVCELLRCSLLLICHLRCHSVFCSVNRRIMGKCYHILCLISFSEMLKVFFFICLWDVKFSAYQRALANVSFIKYNGLWIKKFKQFNKTCFQLHISNDWIKSTGICAQCSTIMWRQKHWWLTVTPTDTSLEMIKRQEWKESLQRR